MSEEGIAMVNAEAEAMGHGPAQPRFKAQGQTTEKSHQYNYAAKQKQIWIRKQDET